jgi:Dynamin family
MSTHSTVTRSPASDSADNDMPLMNAIAAPAHPSTFDQACLRLVATVETACAAYGRTDLLPNVQRLREVLGDQRATTVIAGEFKKGKSSLLNALLGAELSYVGDDIATQVPLRVIDGRTPEVQVTMIDGASRMMPRSTLTNILRGSGEPVAFATVSFEHPLLSTGLELVDSAGVGGLESQHGLATLAEISRALGVVLVLDASQELTKSELSFIRTVDRLCPRVIIAMTKIDIHVEWRDILRLNQQHLADGGVDVAIVPVAVGRSAGAETISPRNAASITPLTEWLQQLVDDSDEVRRGHCCSTLGAVVAELAQQFHAERRSLTDADHAAQAMRTLSELKQQTEALRGQMAKWSQTLNDGIGDLNADIDHDLRTRLRVVGAEADEAVDHNDPGTSWADISAWLNNRVGQEMVANFMLLHDRSDRLSELVAEHFNHPLAALAEASEVFGIVVELPTAKLAATSPEAIAGASMTVRAKGMTAARGFYSSTLMTSMLGSVAGLALGPIGLVLGAAGGRSTLRAEKNRMLEQRRAQARQKCRKYIDEIGFEVGKELRDSLRSVHRQLRDHYSQRAEVLHSGSTAAYQAAQAATKRSAAENAARLADVDAELTRLRSVEALIVKLRTTGASS